MDMTRLVDVVTPNLKTLLQGYYQLALKRRLRLKMLLQLHEGNPFGLHVYHAPERMTVRYHFDLLFIAMIAALVVLGIRQSPLLIDFHRPIIPGKGHV